MMVIRMLPISTIGLALLLAMGCKSKGPVPTEEAASNQPAKVGSTEMGGAHPATGMQNPHEGMQNPHEGMQDPHAGMMPTENPHGGGTFGEPDAAAEEEVRLPGGSGRHFVQGARWLASADAEVLDEAR